jgi:predicted lactoylglutathione lyase
MIQECWLNLPVQDVQKSKNFFEQLGFHFHEERSSGTDSACMLVGKKPVIVMLFQTEIFNQFIGKKNEPIQSGNEILISIDAESRAEVDQYSEKVAAIGGTIFGKSVEIGNGMYGCGFRDLDGHRWNVLYMGQ